VIGLVSAGIGIAGAGVGAGDPAARRRVPALAEKSPPVGTCLAWRSDDASPVLRAFAETARTVARSASRARRRGRVSSLARCQHRPDAHRFARPAALATTRRIVFALALASFVLSFFHRTAPARSPAN